MSASFKPGIHVTWPMAAPDFLKINEHSWKFDHLMVYKNWPNCDQLLGSIWLTWAPNGIPSPEVPTLEGIVQECPWAYHPVWQQSFCVCLVPTTNDWSTKYQQQLGVSPENLDLGISTSLAFRDQSYMDLSYMDLTPKFSRILLKLDKTGITYIGILWHI